ncbi:MAG: glycosyltransferase family 4 protein [Pseudomonadota bacterium]
MNATAAIQNIDVIQQRPLHVLLCPDQVGWSFDNIANNIEIHCGPNRVSKLYMADVNASPHRIFETILTRKIDVCHIFWREDLFRLFRPEAVAKAARRLNLGTLSLVRAIGNCAFTTSVYDHLFSSEEELSQRRFLFALADGYTVSSSKLRNIYSSGNGLVPPDTMITDGVDIDHFKPLQPNSGTIGNWKIGWAGNSQWGAKSQNYDVKGFHSVFKPAIHQVQEHGYAIRVKVADPQVQRIDFRDMPRFYNDLDVFVCTSAIEGTPNTVLEAMACGIPVVSSNVGIVPDAFGAHQAELIVNSRDPREFAEKLGLLLRDRQLRNRIGDENVKQAKLWTWKEVTKPWWPFWRKALAHTTSPRARALREAFLTSY